ncbi:hypothetical protein [Photobacterium indicum]|uniref:Uncharacterized protein n=1 Tax=Photobacterium indicum TaxID=81447 RepID=A0A2T3LF51_9GAMM|nr:hypothetical protein [Photobacterium indicum]PSV50007.1 hypothetical protein C9J47_05515 [Photobacterium indicum]
MKKGEINEFDYSVTQRVRITAPIEIEVRGGGKIMTLVIAGQRVDVFKGMCIHLLKAQREYEKSAF